MATVIKTTFKLKRGTSTRWAELNPILEQGEPGFAYDINLLKVGDGVTAWNDLPYVNDKEEPIIYAENRNDFPTEGEYGTIYVSAFDRAIYIWSDETQTYEELISKSVNVNDLVQDEGSVLILYGGSATDNI